MYIAKQIKSRMLMPEGDNVSDATLGYQPNRRWKEGLRSFALSDEGVVAERPVARCRYA